MSQLPFAFARPPAPSRADRIDSALYLVSAFVGLALLLGAGASVGYMIGLWLFD